tara:strand:- start:113163 stop:113939 length:777 start_codon:yes stop_codon:yes gene_type:complete
MTDSSPQSPLAESLIPTEPGPGQGTLEQGLAGTYPLSLSEVVKEAWGRVAGNKGALWIGAAIYIAVHFVIALVLGLFLGGDAPVPTPDAGVQISTPGENLAEILATVLTLPLGVGLMFLGVAVASGRQAIPTSLFSWYDRFLKLALTWILMTIMVLIGTLLLVLPGIYLAVSYQLALPLVADKGLGPWEALETSRKTVTHKWFTFFGLGLVGGLAATGSVLLLGIPLIWVLPTCLIGIGIMYRNAIGVEASTLDRVSN